MLYFRFLQLYFSRRWTSEGSMQMRHGCGTLLSVTAVLASFCLMPWLASAQANGGQDSMRQACPGDESGLKLPSGFCATVFADGIGHARHLVVAPNGVVYVNTWSGRYYGNDTPPSGGFLVALQDTKGTGRADV